MNGFFSMDGRISRKELFRYWIGALVWFFISLAVSSIEENTGAIMILALWGVNTIQIVKRFHDMNMSGLYCLGLYFVPFYNLYLLICLLFVKGSIGSNQYGADPLSDNTDAKK